MPVKGGSGLQELDVTEGRYRPGMAAGLEAAQRPRYPLPVHREGPRRPVYNAANVPETVGRGTLDPELEAWVPSGPTLGADVPIAQGRRDHFQLGVGPWPSIGAVDTLVLPGRSR
jgi:hypothetical protein